MKNRLDQLEARLQGLIESSVALFARGDAQRQLAHQLVAAMQQHLQTQSDGRTMAPEDYLIYLHPEALTYWQVHEDQLELIASSLQEASREFEVYFLNPPALHLSVDPRLPLDGLRVIPSGPVRPTGSTAALAAQSGPPANLPRNAFLIVDGNRIFPLNRTVINLGRRADNHLVLVDPRVSRAHAQIRVVRGQFVLFDLNSTGGTFINSQRIHQQALKPGDVISLSGVSLIYGEDNLPEDETDRAGYTQAIAPDFPPSDPPEVIE